MGFQLGGRPGPPGTPPATPMSWSWQPMVNGLNPTRQKKSIRSTTSAILSCIADGARDKSETLMLDIFNIVWNEKKHVSKSTLLIFSSV